MKNYLAVLPVFAIALPFLMATAPASAGEKATPETITCEDFLNLDETVQPAVVYWLYGKSGEVDYIDVDEFQRPVAYVVTECYDNKQATVKEKVEQHKKAAKK